MTGGEENRKEEVRSGRRGEDEVRGEMVRQRGRGRTPLRANEIHLGNLNLDDPMFDDSVPQNMFADYAERSHSDSEDSGLEQGWVKSIFLKNRLKFHF